MTKYLLILSQAIFGLSLMICICGCAHVISQEMRKIASEDIPFQWVAENPERYQGMMVIWGGEIVQTQNVNEGTLIDILQRPLGYSEEPIETEISAGRFLVLYQASFFNLTGFSRGKKITVAGRIVGKKALRFGDSEEEYPFLSGQEIYLWDEELLKDYPPSQPRYRYPYYQ